ncbi:AmmeMemoRadiSam system protein A [bacterium]|nr:AmmeMemoRadiSam system protein A [bacterium]
MFDSSQKTILLKLARDAIRTYLETQKEIAPSVEEFLKEPGAAFVTLKIDEELRGCIGSTDGSEPLGKTVIHCAISAAFRDPRFPPLSVEEYPFVDLEISVLSAFRRVANPEEVIAGTHGIMLTRDYHRGLLLPQVAVEYDWDRDTFLSFTCRKAGLEPDAWKDPDTIIEIFTAEVFGEKD